MEVAALIINYNTDVIVCDEWVAISIHSMQHDTRLEKRTCSMKTIGLIGGMSWESTVTYYQIINEIVKIGIWRRCLIENEENRLRGFCLREV